MPLGYHINTDEGLITVRGDGNVAVTEIVELGDSLLDDNAFDPELPQLLDFRGLRPRPPAEISAETEFAGLWDFVHSRYRTRIAANVAVVIDEHLEARHCADIFLLTCAISDAELFADYDQALKWLMREAFALRMLPPTSGEQQDARTDHADGAPE